jgi:glutathione peroxidase
VGPRDFSRDPTRAARQNAAMQNTAMTTIHDFTPDGPDGTPHPLAQYRGKVVLIVNTASKCGFTPQYEGLEALWRAHGAAGLVVLAFPCNQFGAQEPGDAAEIARFCNLTYDVSFPVLAKIDVNGAMADPLYVHLKGEKRGLLGTESIKWNFTKFLIGRDGRVIGRYAPQTKPAALETAIGAALAERDGVYGEGI